MNGLEIWLLAVGLAMDCFAISIASGILLKRTLWRPMLTMAFFFGLFQAIMPLLGWIGASTFSHLIESMDHWIAFIILAFLGGRMVRESFKDEDCKKEYDPKSLKVVLALAVATSIDALAIGVSFAFLGMRDFSEILAPISIIGFVSFIMSLIGLLFGIRFGCGIARKLRAELIEGAEKLDALSALMRHMAGREDTFTEDQARGVAVLAIRVRSLSAKAKKH